MSTENTNTVAANPSESRAEDLASRWQRVVRRRSFLSGLGLAGASVAASAGDLSAEDNNNQLTRGDAALLQFALLAETIETDLWQQYNELGGAVDHNDNPNPGNPDYVSALSKLDGDMPQYISDNTDDEISHRDFLKAYLMSKRVNPVDLSPFKNLTSPNVTGAAKTGRITNLKTLTVDTSWYFRYRSTQNPDLGAQFPQLINIVNQPAIPLQNSNAQTTIQAIANVAARRIQPVSDTGSESYQPRSSANPFEYWRGRDRPFFPLAR